MAQIITDLELFKIHFGPIDGNFAWANLEPFVTDAERDIISETLGDEVLNFFAGPNLTDKQNKVLQLLRRSVAYLSMLKWSETAMFRFTDQALFLAKNNNGLVPSDKKIRDLKNFLEETGFTFLDKVITAMEADLDSFPVYADSGVRQTMLQGFIKTAQDFSRQNNINNSRITFLSMLSTMLDLQDRLLPEIMGELYYEKFKEAYLDNELTPAEEKLLPLIKKGIAHYTISEACKDLPLKISAKGIFINKFVDSKEYDQREAADVGRIQFLSDDQFDKGQRKLQDLRLYLLKNAASYPDFIVPESKILDYNDDSGFFIF